MTSWHPITLTPPNPHNDGDPENETDRQTRTNANKRLSMPSSSSANWENRQSASPYRDHGDICLSQLEARLTPLGNNHDAITQCRKLSYKRRPYRACKDSYVLLEVEDLIIIHFNSFAGLPQCPPKGETTTNTTVPPITDTERLDDH